MNFDKINKIKNICIIAYVGIFLYGALILQISTPDAERSDSERRLLQQKPVLNKENVASGAYMTDFETYTQDQFPYRDSFRGVKAFTSLYVFRQKEIHDLYEADGYYVKVEYPLDMRMVDNALDKFRFIYDTYLKDTDVNIYGSIVPDKNYFMADKSNHVKLDYDGLADKFETDADYMNYIDIMPLLSIEDYYKTDTHWKQECIVDVAEHIGDAMGVKVAGMDEYTIKKLDEPFYGVYYSQLPINKSKDELKYLDNDTIQNCIVTSYDTGKTKLKAMYDFEKGAGKDPYELFLSGSDALITIENPAATTDRELVVFRDSFGSSLTPLLIKEYSKVTLIDIRYVNTQMLGFFVKFDKQDVLFIYSTLLLNNSLSFK